MGAIIIVTVFDLYFLLPLVPTLHPFWFGPCILVPEGKERKFSKFFHFKRLRKSKIGKMSTIPVDSEGRETCFGHANLGPIFNLTLTWVG